MATNRQTQRSARLVLYGIAFRLLSGLAVQAGDGKAGAAARRRDGRGASCQPRRKERRALPVKLDLGR